MHLPTRVLAPAFSIFLVTVSSVEALTRHVAVNGMDVPTCGTPSQPCRTITMGLSQADPYDTILVGPGTYGRVYGEAPGGCFIDAPPRPDGVPWPSCIIRIDKPVRVLSSAGVAATIITDLGVPLVNGAVVTIASDEAVFGGPHQGFTVMIGGGSIDYPTHGIRGGAGVSDNVVHRTTFPGAVAGTGIATRRALRNRVFGTFFEGFRLLDGDAAYLNAAAFLGEISGHPQGHPRGFRVIGTARVVGNVATSYNEGFTLGCSAAGCPLRVAGNTAIHNTVGMRVFATMPFAVAGNNFYGNVDCGVRQTGPVDLSDNYWGAATGPGADPADDLCIGSAAGLPFSTEAFPVFIRPIR